MALNRKVGYATVYTFYRENRHTYIYFIFSQTLFLVYINNLCNLQLYKGKIITFADDTVLLFSNAQIGYNRVASWLRSKVLTLNVSKTKYLPFAYRKDILILPSVSLSITAHQLVHYTTTLSTYHSHFHS